MSSRLIVVSYRLEMHHGFETACQLIERHLHLNPDLQRNVLQFEQINELPACMNHWSKATPAEKLWVAWVLFFLRKWCYVELPHYRECLWQALFHQGGSAALYNDLMAISSIHLNGLYWLASPNFANMSRNVRQVHYYQHFLTIYCEMESPAGPIAPHLLSGSPP